MAREWSKISWEELKKDENYNIHIDGVLEGRIFKIDHGKWKFEIYFEAYDLGPWGNKTYPRQLKQTYRDQGDARKELVHLWEKYKPEIDISDIPEVDITIDNVQEDTDPSFTLPNWSNIFSNTP